jgi:hypothetical protein
VIQRFGVWLRGGGYRFVLPVVFLMMLQTVVLALFGGGATIVLGTIVVVTLAIMAGAYISENGGSR